MNCFCFLLTTRTTADEYLIHGLPSLFSVFAVSETRPEDLRCWQKRGFHLRTLSHRLEERRLTPVSHGLPYGSSERIQKRYHKTVLNTRSRRLGCFHSPRTGVRAAPVPGNVTLYAWARMLPTPLTCEGESCVLQRFIVRIVRGHGPGILETTWIEMRNMDQHHPEGGSWMENTQSGNQEVYQLRLLCLGHCVRGLAAGERRKV